MQAGPAEIDVNLLLVSFLVKLRSRHFRGACSLALIVTCSVAACTDASSTPDAPSTGVGHDGHFRLLERDSQSFDAPPPGYADPDMGVDSSSWRLARSFDHTKIFLGMSGETQCILVIEGETGTQACDARSSARPLTVLSEMTDEGHSVLYLGLQNSYRAIKLSDLVCVAANNIVVINDPPGGKSKIVGIDEQGDIKRFPVPVGGDGRSGENNPSCV